MDRFATARRRPHPLVVANPARIERNEFTKCEKLLAVSPPLAWLREFCNGPVDGSQKRTLDVGQLSSPVLAPVVGALLTQVRAASRAVHALMHREEGQERQAAMRAATEQGSPMALAGGHEGEPPKLAWAATFAETSGAELQRWQTQRDSPGTDGVEPWDHTWPTLRGVGLWRQRSFNVREGQALELLDRHGDEIGKRSQHVRAEAAIDVSNPEVRRLEVQGEEYVRRLAMRVCQAAQIAAQDIAWLGDKPVGQHIIYARLAMSSHSDARRERTWLMTPASMRESPFDRAITAASRRTATVLPITSPARS